MEVMKFGGAVLKNKEGFFRMLNIIKNSNALHMIIVVSAFSTSTRKIKSATLLAEKGKINDSLKIVDNIEKAHYRIISHLLTNHSVIDYIKDFLKNSFLTIRQYLESIAITKELLPKTLDFLLSFGEQFALRTVDSFLKEYNIKHGIIDASDIFVTDNNYGSAKPLLTETKENVNNILIPALDANRIILIQGFVAKSIDGNITTMGIESSNLSASLLACMVNASKLTFWTDVEGISTADPKIVPIAKNINFLNYSEAYIASLAGLKLIYPSMIKHAEDYGLTMIYRSAFKEKGLITTVSNIPDSYKLPLIITKDNLSLKTSKFDNNNLVEASEIQNSDFFVKALSTSICLSSKIQVKSNNRTKHYEDMEMITILNCKKNISSKIYSIITKTLNTDNFFFYNISAEQTCIVIVPKAELKSLVIKIHKEIYK